MVMTSSQSGSPTEKSSSFLSFKAFSLFKFHRDRRVMGGKKKKRKRARGGRERIQRWKEWIL